jgi:hypothetical protein
MTMSALSPTIDEQNLWLPPKRMARYQLIKLGGGLIMITIFVGWLVLQWSNLSMRWFALTLLTITTWVVVMTCINDRLRSRGRQLSIDSNHMVLTKPNEQIDITLSDVAYAQWREDDMQTAGLWLFDRSDQELAHLDLDFLGDQDEARSFLRWARQRTDFSFEVRWPVT